MGRGRGRKGGDRLGILVIFGRAVLFLYCCVDTIMLQITCWFGVRKGRFGFGDETAMAFVSVSFQS